MKIKTLILDNFGLFRGRNEINLDTRVSRGTVRPIVLIGGKNGSGKTSILEAIRVCLYGPQGIADRISVKDYENYLRGRVHRDDSLLINPTTAAVTLVFEHAHIGAKHEFTVTRSWDLKGNGIESSLKVLCDGIPLDEIDRENAEDFLKDLVPPGVAQLYFFDGEKIQDLAEAEDVDAALSDAIKSLLGLELVERLQADLRIYKNRIDGDDSNSGIVKEIENIECDLQQKKTALIDLRDSRDTAVSNRDSIQRDIAIQERRIAKEGGAYANKREQLEIRKRTLSENISQLETEIRGHAENLLPFAIVPELCDAIRAQLADERQIQEWHAVEKVIEQRGAKFAQSIETALQVIKSQIGGDVLSEVNSKISAALSAFSEKPESLESASIIHNLSGEQQTRLLTGIELARTDVPTQADKLNQSLERETRTLLKLEQALKQVPNEDQLRPMVEAINSLNQKLGAAQTIVGQQETALAAAEFAIKDSKRKLEKAEKLRRDSGKLHEKQELAEAVQEALKDYHTELLHAKSVELSTALMTRFSQLWRKGDRAKRIEIHPDTYEVVLYDRHERPVPKKELSAGEKQIYAIAILWALADVSGRPLPMVIDTPLGRLDGDHRSHLVDRYFPYASHQVIILSTDTEIGESYFNDLAPFISHAVHLQYDQDDARTRVEEGYFWKRKSKKKELLNAT